MEPYNNSFFYQTLVKRFYTLIRYHCHLVSATELENLLANHPAVQESLVYGMEEPSVCELVSAVVVLKAGMRVS